MNAHTGGTAHSTHGFAHPESNIDALHIIPGMTVADFGSGSGAYVYAIAKRLRNSGHIYAIDVQKDLLRRIHNESERLGFSTVHIVWGDVEAPQGSKIAEGTIDLVLISNMLFQVSDPHMVLREARRILKDDGKLAVIEWSDSFGGLGPQKQDIVTKDALIEIAEREKFVVDDEFRAGAHHYGVLCSKSEKRSPHIQT